MQLQLQFLLSAAFSSALFRRFSSRSMRRSIAAHLLVLLHRQALLTQHFHGRLVLLPKHLQNDALKVCSCAVAGNSSSSSTSYLLKLSTRTLLASSRASGRRNLSCSRRRLSLRVLSIAPSGPHSAEGPNRLNSSSGFRYRHLACHSSS